jgi:hypothetical protein
VLTICLRALISSVILSLFSAFERLPQRLEEIIYMC